jgi:succinate dehydrogenase / fumarate reductase, iron-sulfur subunit
MNFHLKVWRQAGPRELGRMVDYEARNVPSEASFLEMLDIVNEDLTSRREIPIQFDHDCREGICGTCGLTINGVPHGRGCAGGETTCQLYMREFSNGSTIYIEPFRATSFPVLCDLSVDRSALDRIIQAGGFISERSGSASDANAHPIPKATAELAMDAAACIGCGACVAACPNSSAMLFVAAKVTHLELLPQGKLEARQRVLNMIHATDAEGFGGCSNFYECEAVCPAGIPVEFISRTNRHYTTASLRTAIGMPD